MLRVQTFLIRLFKRKGMAISLKDSHLIPTNKDLKFAAFTNFHCAHFGYLSQHRSLFAYLSVAAELWHSERENILKQNTSVC